MKNDVRKRGQKFIRRFSRASVKASEESKEHIKENFVGRLSHINNIRLLIVEWSLLIVALIMLAVTQAFWFGGSYAEEAFSNGGTYTEATLGEVKSMNPLFAMTDSEKVLSKLMFATLSTVDYSGHAGIGLASSIRPNEDGSVWTVKLREGLQWSDGEPITNEDVVFTAGLLKNPAVNSVFDSNLTNVKVSENDKGQIVFELPSAYADFITALNFPIVPSHVLKDVDPQTLIENNFSNMPVTSGPFSFNAVQTTSQADEKVYYLTSNPHYYKGKTLLDSFAVHTYNSKDGIIGAINSGSVTATAELTGAEAEQITSKQFNEKDSSLNSGAFIFFNTKRPGLKEASVRTAIRQGMNMEKIRASVPNATKLDYPLLDTQIKLSVYPEVPAYNVAEASSKLNEAFPEGKPKLNLVTVNSGFLPKVADTVKTELEELGFEVDMTSFDETQDFINNIISKRGYDILVYEIELGTDPDLLPYYHSSQANSAGLNLSNYRNVMVDDLLLGARDMLNLELRAKKYESFLEYWVSEAPAIGIYQTDMSYYYNKNVRPFGDSLKLVTAIDRFNDINDWAVTKETKNKTP